MNANRTVVSLVSNTLTSLVDGIIQGEYTSGFLPPQDVLAKKFNVSRTVLREAIAMMLSRNMITVKPKIGTKINPQDQWLVLVPQSHLQIDQEVYETLDMFMSLYRAKGWEGDAAYQRAAKIVETCVTRSKVQA